MFFLADYYLSGMFDPVKFLINCLAIVHFKLMLNPWWYQNFLFPKDMVEIFFKTLEMMEKPVIIKQVFYKTERYIFANV